jgi:hypothetical protein
VEFNTEVVQVHSLPTGDIKVNMRSPAKTFDLTAPWVFNCTYSGLNQIRKVSGMPLLPLKHELTEMALLSPPDILRGIAVTVMCGPFFSLMPFPDLNQWTLSHVRYTPHHSWIEGPDSPDPYTHLDSYHKKSNARLMLLDSSRYLPALSSASQSGSLWEIKTLLPQSELDDGRPILFHRDSDLRGLISIMGGKIDNIYDIPQELDILGL